MKRKNAESENLFLGKRRSWKDNEREGKKFQVTRRKHRKNWNLEWILCRCIQHEINLMELKHIIKRNINMKWSKKISCYLFHLCIRSENRIGPNPKCVPCGRPSEKKFKWKLCQERIIKETKKNETGDRWFWTKTRHKYELTKKSWESWLNFFVIKILFKKKQTQTSKKLIHEESSLQ
jgi:hypothetical protein